MCGPGGWQDPLRRVNGVRVKALCGGFVWERGRASPWSQTNGDSLAPERNTYPNTVLENQ